MRCAKPVVSLVISLGACFFWPAYAASDAVVPALRVTAPNGQKSVLIGSIHIGVEGLRQPNASIFKGARSYVVEQLPEEGPPAEPRKLSTEALVAGMASGQPGLAKWAQQLSPQELMGLKERLRCNGVVPPNQLDEAFKLVLAMERPLTAAELAIRRCSLTGKKSRDELLAQYAKANGIRASSLELNAEVEPRRLSVPDRIYLHQLRVAMTAKQEQALNDAAEALNRGDYDALREVLRRLAANQADFELYERLMIANRNGAWMSKLLAHLAVGNAVINVGAAHLPGKDGLIQMLRDRGCVVEPVMLPEEPGS